ncbi:MAG: pyrroloquinoline quinone biosynthesis protein PqqE [Gammaproteobacteria bacterium]|nr:pyrroloquinoline quinone biosynthesis protein PqqE [Gammaproteobacteria bacterium]
MSAKDNRIGMPVSILFELTHRCPLQCPYCSNPLQLEQAANELTTEQWSDLMEQAVKMGILQVHFSGGEPTLRRDLEDLVGKAEQLGLYSNLITSGVGLDDARVENLAGLGLKHVQISVQDSAEESANRIAGHRDGYAQKRIAARAVRRNNLPLTVNAPIHKMNIGHLPSIIDLAVDMGASRMEVAHVQYYGWAYHNRASLMPKREQLERATDVVERARERLKGVLVIDYVVPDYYARKPKACMGGWARQFLNVTPSGKVLPCHAAESITALQFDNVRERSLMDIWQNSESFEKYRGTDWMPEKCLSCPRREIDWGGCRCQAFAITGDAANMDPACEFSEHHEHLVNIALLESGSGETDFDYRRLRGIPVVHARA